ncbi:MAG TPA: hypothetical protein DDY88_00370 [Actinobacteria bacterium]|nr:hypothetical protein [Actinomycetota bacterium]
MAARRSLSLALACVTTCLLMLWSLFHDQFLDSALMSLLWLALAVGVGVLAVRAAWLTSDSEDPNPRL